MNMKIWKSYLPNAIFLIALFAKAQPTDPLLLRNPSVSGTHVVFNYGNQLWIIPRDGGTAQLLTTGPGAKTTPFLSPDGKWVSYTGKYNGISNVYVVSSAGGAPRRLTFSSGGSEEVVGWTPDSGRVLFRSSASSPSWFTRLFTISIDGGFPQDLPLPEGVMGSFSPDGQSIAYVPMWNWGTDHGWKHYRGGRTARIWIANLSDSSTESISRDNSNDFDPMWIGDKVYFLSDRNRAVTLFSYDIKSRTVEELLPPGAFDIQWATAAPGAIVYEQIGTLRKLDLFTHQVTDLKVQLSGDLSDVQPHIVKVGDHISSYNISPTGVRAVFEAHGEILTVPAEKGEIRNLTNTAGVAERDPAWSPDGRWIAYFSDESGEYALHLRSQDGSEVRKINLGESNAFYYSPQWSPDSKEIAYTDQRLNLWYLEIAKGIPIKIDTDYYVSPFRAIDVAWSPDASWIAYIKQLPSHMHALFVYSVADFKTTQITDGMSDIRYPAFDPNGKYLYFTAGTDFAQTIGWLDLSGFARPATRSVYALLLRKDVPYPFLPESDEERITSQPGSAVGIAAPPVQEKSGTISPNAVSSRKTEAPLEIVKKPSGLRIDFEDIDKRIVPLPVAPRNYTGLQVGTGGMVYLIDSPPGPGMLPNNGSRSVLRFEMESRRLIKVIDGVNSFQVSFDGKKAIYGQRAGQHTRWNIARLPGSTPSIGEAPPLLRGEALKTDELSVYVNPREEWHQMFNEAFRIERDFFYDPHLHGLDWIKLKKLYEPFISALSCRDDLNYVLNDIFGRLGTSHVASSSPEQEPSSQPATGFLGADYEIDHSRYRIKKIYKKDTWVPDLRSPLTEPGVEVREGDYLLAVDGRELRSTDNIDEFLQDSAGKATALTLANEPSGKERRRVTVVPIASEGYLRSQAWISANRRHVDELSGGRIAYIFVPDTRGGGYASFNRYFFTQLGKQAVLVDERFNRGGLAPDYIVDVLRKPFLSYWGTREGHDFTTPVGANPGPKALLVNMYAGSGGDALAWYFRREKLGPIVGTRTWGGLIGTYDYPQFIDGGEISTPQLAPYNEKSEWAVENQGVPPDVKIDISPRQWREGRDPQLEKAVEILLQQLSTNPVHMPSKPTHFPVFDQNTSAAKAKP
jgi:tricorn protease